MQFNELRDILRDMLGDDCRPVVAYTGVVALARAFPPPASELPQRMLDALLDAVGSTRTLLMPTHVNGFRDGVLDLDHEPCTTGMVNELFRQLPGSSRTASVFWPFSAHGPQAAELAALRPLDAWGDGSLFEWLHLQDAHLLMLGVPWFMCSFLHRVEWLARVPYRYLKTFEGMMIQQGRREPLREQVFVRQLQPTVHNIWPELDHRLAAAGMRRQSIGRSQVAAIGARALVNALLPIAQANPYAFVSEPERIRRAFPPIAA